MLILDGKNQISINKLKLLLRKALYHKIYLYLNLLSSVVSMMWVICDFWSVKLYWLPLNTKHHKWKSSNLSFKPKATKWTILSPVLLCNLYFDVYVCFLFFFLGGLERHQPQPHFFIQLHVLLLLLHLAPQKFKMLHLQTSANNLMCTWKIFSWCLFASSTCWFQTLIHSYTRLHLNIQLKSFVVL